ncbi:hypothetical protein CYMTET_12447 [Cymbomonas tetramitiformis]|uniref:HAT C-terminal dimerisation domain-containing protein n=1 Tax=Cymbomonas tetramitiformis TaxID=36881 RepID=A0AAE0LC55_9CHLO|nr:hypothetical protein CYMTET_12447 [Cymbomonas tetramitiformis]
MTNRALVSFSNTRWWSKQEVENNIALNFGQLSRFLELLDSRGIGDATTKKLLSIYKSDPLKLKVSFAAGLDGLLSMLKTTYELEGDRLEIVLAFRRIETLRAYGRQLLSVSENRGLLPNVDVVIRMSLEPTVGLAIKKEFAGHGVFLGKIMSIDKEDTGKWWYQIEYGDGDRETMDIEELRAFDLTWTCEACYDCTHSYLVFELAQLFDPSFGSLKAGEIDATWVQRLAAIVPLAREAEGSLITKLEGELAAYITLASGFCCEHNDVDTFSDAVLSWWRNNGTEIPSWSLAARIVFSLSPNSCTSERVFSLLSDMFGDKQIGAMADYVQATLMLRYNSRL